MALILRLASAMSTALSASALLKQYLSVSNHFEQDDLFKRLIKIIHNQNKELMYYKSIEINLKHNLSEFNELLFDQSDEPMSLNTKVSLDSLYFVTITFDPHRFDNLELSTEISQKKYIIKQWHQLRHKISFVYGCFEKHKSGIIHSHCILETTDSESVMNQLMKAFSSKPNNKHAIDISEVRDISKCLRYIDTQIDKTGALDKQKQKYGFYKLENHSLGKNV